MKAWVGFRIVERSSGNRRDAILGDLHEVYLRGITIGGFDDCSVRLDGPSAAGVRAKFSGGSNHRFVVVESAPASSPLFASLGQTRRVDFLPFEIGDFTLQILEVELDRTIEELAARGERFEKALANLAPFGSDGRAACPRLLANLLDGDKIVRSGSLDALRKLGINVKLTSGVRSVMVSIPRRQVVSEVSRCAADLDPEVRFHAVSVLADLRALEALNERLCDSAPRVRIRAAEMLWKLTRRPEGVVDVLRKALTAALAQETEGFPTAIYATAALRGICPAARPAIPELALAARKRVYGARDALVAIGGPDAALP